MRTGATTHISHPTLMKGWNTGPEARMRILLVEDEVKMARAVRRGLEQEGYAVDAVAAGEDAMHRALEEDYDAIILDVMLPGRDGFAICRELRTKGRWAPVLMLTARDGVEDRVRGLDAGADDYLVKPFSFAELLARLRALVRRGAAERPTELATHDVVLDPAAHTVTREGEPIELSAREFELLEFLMRHSGEVVSRTRILEHVWDMNYEHFSNVVDVYVGYLRKKLEVPFDRPFIRTVRGVGYGVGLG
jgi:two-component system OmpR family response regulator